ncbi:hypothetical protein BGX27_005851 [Mortierella sp. AM989]|nr:hypothetical protein BGX27_005851 [Mortierella sp. AM989]
MLLSTNPAVKLVSLTLAALMYAATSVTAAPVITLNAKALPTMIHDIECVKVTAPILSAGSTDALGRVIVANKEIISINIDASGCEPTLMESAKPWLVTLNEESQGLDRPIELANTDITNQNSFDWIASAPHTQKHNLDLGGQVIAESMKPGYFIKVQATTNGGQQQLVGKTNAFVIVNISAPQKRDSPETDVYGTPKTTSVLENAPVDVDDSSLPGPPMADTTDDIDSSIPVPSASDAPAFPAITEDNSLEVLQSSIADPAANVNVGPSILASPPLIPQVPLAPQAPSPDNIILSSDPTYPNVPDTPADSSDLPKPLNPPFVPQINEPTPQPNNRLDIFYKYAAAGGALLSLVGLGVGGIVGGVIGGTVGLVAGLLLAGINTFILG